MKTVEEIVSNNGYVNIDDNKVQVGSGGCLVVLGGDD